MIIVFYQKIVVFLRHNNKKRNKLTIIQKNSHNIFYYGGKMEAGETPEEALKREIREELSTEISVNEFLCTIEYDYPKFHLTMHCYLCLLLTEALHLNEHEAAKWLSINNLDSVKWLPADVKVLEVIKTIIL